MMVMIIMMVNDADDHGDDIDGDYEDDDAVHCW